MRSDILKRIHSQFDLSAHAFCQDTDGLFCEISSEYKKDENPENLKSRTATIYYRSFALRFIYTAHATMNVTNSILGCVVCLDKSEDAIAVPLPLAASYCGYNTKIPMFIPLITNPLGMQQAFDCIARVLQDLLPLFADISCNTEQYDAFLAAYAQELQVIFELDEEPANIAAIAPLAYEFFTLRFSSDAFICYLRGDVKAAVKRLRKIKKRTDYETQMLSLWQSDEDLTLPALSAITENTCTYNSKGVQKADVKEFFAMFLSWFALTIPIGGCYSGVFFLLLLLEGRESVYLMGPEYSYPYCIMLGFITAIAASYFTRFRFYKLLFRKNYQRFCELDSVQNGGGSDRIMKGFLRFLVIVGIAGCILLSKWNVNFKEDGFVDNTKFFSLRGEYIEYSEIQRVYYRPDRVNDFGETLPFPSYVIALRNGEEIDLYEFDEIPNYDDLLEYLQTKGVNVEK